MTAALFTLCAWWCTSSPSWGAMLVRPEHAAVDVGGGLNGVFPTLSLGATAGLARAFDLGVRYDTAAGLQHDLTLTGRLRLADRWATSLALSHGFFTVEEIGGIRSAQSPFGNGVTSTHAVHFSRLGRGDVHVAFSLGVTFRWWALEEDLGTVALAFSPTVHHAHAEVVAEWGGSGGTTYVRFRALVPIQAEFRVLGYLPLLVVGRTWNLP